MSSSVMSWAAAGEPNRDRQPQQGVAQKVEVVAGVAVEQLVAAVEDRRQVVESDGPGAEFPA